MKKSTPPERWGLAVYTMIRDARGRVLVLQRSQATKHFRGYWEFPGGKPAPGERIEKTAQLEAAEESGLDITPEGVAGAVEGSVPGLRIAMLIFEARVPTTDVTLSDEHDAFCWLPPSQLRTLKLRPGFDKFIATYFKLLPQRRASKTKA